ncbi:zinc ribbon domain-containing protein [Marinobacterium weihaiense]|uniref:Zinc ribbon domain-containing protein n=1 Tax=Marinobacterium weihaiense TaxID=2851016 RepID=A0ABS6MFH6_9GAMM|nr:zinc ribbon domain-containing protein [Marinobacterium weihaiense]MBV0934905.1 zinc ribbon domain-containing protein [Marinobacterium weihaiense]
MAKRKQCPQCGELMVQGAYQCSNCGTSLENAEVIEVSEQGVVTNANVTSAPALTSWLNGLGVISLLAGLFITATLWPTAPRGVQVGLQFYLPALLWLFLGVMQCILFASFGAILHYLKRIAVAAESKERSTQP